MKLKSIIIIFNLIFLHQNLIAQDLMQKIIDSLKSELLINHLDDTTAVNNFSKISSMFYFYNPDSGIEYGKKGIELATKINYMKGLAKCNNAVGACYWAKSYYTDALDYYFKSLKVNEELNIKTEIIKNYVNIGIIYTDLQDYNRALDYFNKSIQLCDEINESKENVYTNIGRVYSDLKDYKRGNEFQEKALKVLIEKNETYKQYINLHNIGNNYYHLKDFAKAVDYFNQSLGICEKYGVKSGIAHSFERLGLTYYSIAIDSISSKHISKREKYSYLNKSIEISKKSMKLATETLSNNLLLLVYWNIANAYKELNILDSAYKYSEQCRILNDSIYQKTTLEKIRNIESSREKDIIKNIQKEKEIESLKYRFAIVVSILILIISLIIFIYFLKQRKVNKVLNEKNNHILNASKELEELNIQLKMNNIEAQKLVLIRQLQPHFLFNSLTTLKSLIKINVKEAVNYTFKLSEFLRYTFQAYKNDLVLLGEELKFTSDYIELQKVRFENSLIYSVDIPEEKFNYKIPVYALQTLVENAIKHNSFTSENPLLIIITAKNSKIKVWNNKMHKQILETGGTGLANLNKRYQMTAGLDIEITNNDDEFYVELKLLKI